jgi:hypothetical protein
MALLSEETVQLLARLLCPKMRSARCTILPLTDDHRVSATLAATCMKRPVRRRTDPDEVRAHILKVAEERFRRVVYHKTSAVPNPNRVTINVT